MTRERPSWARWRASDPYTLGAEEEIMLLDRGCELAYEAEAVIAALPPELTPHVAPETHGAALEIAAGVHQRAVGVADELRELRGALERAVAERGMRLAGSGTHPCAVWHGTVVSRGARHQQVYGSMRELARREPTFALHVHVGIPDEDSAIRVSNRLRAHLPLLLALSVNSPFWQGRDAGLASARTPLFQAFPRTGIPRAFESYGEWVDTVEALVRSGAFPEPTFLWWDIRLQPRFGTVEVRILDAQTTVDESTALVALVQCLARLEAQDGYAGDRLLASPEMLDENRFLAARDGMDAKLLDPERECGVPARELLDDVLEACLPHARALNCVHELGLVERLAERTGADWQRALARAGRGLPPVAQALADSFTDSEQRDLDASATREHSAVHAG